MLFDIYFLFFPCIPRCIPGHFFWHFFLCIEIEIWEQHNLKLARAHALGDINSILEQHSRRSSDDSKLDSSSNILVVVDDMMNMSSMRRKIYTLARNYNTNYVIAMINCDLEKSISRDLLRTGLAHIGEEVNLFYMCSSFNYSFYFNISNRELED